MRARITFSTTPAVKAYLIALAKQGLHGRDYHEVAERLVCESIQRRIEPTLRLRLPAAEPR